MVAYEIDKSRVLCRNCLLHQPNHGLHLLLHAANLLPHFSPTAISASCHLRSEQLLGWHPATGLVGECSTPRRRARLWSFLLSRRSLQLRPTLYPRLDLVVIGWGSSRTSVGLSISPLPPNVKDCTQAVGTCSYSFAVIGKFSTSHVTAQKALYNKENNDPEEEMSS